MIVLGVETSGLQGTLALLRDGDCLAARSLEQPGRRHAQTLVAEVQRLLHEFGLAPRDLHLLAVSIGPGSFTGLRVGVVFAKTYAYATGAALAAVDTLRAIAAESPADISRLHVIADAQRNELFVGTYRRDAHGDVHREGPIRIESTDAWLCSLRPGDFVAGPGLVRTGQPAGRFTVLTQQSISPRAETIARLGEAQHKRRELADLWELEPFYLRRSAAEERAEQGTA